METGDVQVQTGTRREQYGPIITLVKLSTRTPLDWTQASGIDLGTDLQSVVTLVYESTFSFVVDLSAYGVIGLFPWFLVITIMLAHFFLITNTSVLDIS